MTSLHVLVHARHLPHNGRIEIELEGIRGVSRLLLEPRVEFLVGHRSRELFDLGPDQALPGIVALNESLQCLTAFHKYFLRFLSCLFVALIVHRVGMVLHGYFEKGLLGVGVGGVFFYIQSSKWTGGAHFRFDGGEASS